MQVPVDSLGSIIGKGGQGIKALQESTGANIDVKKTTDGNSETVPIKIRGDEPSVQAAAAAIRSIAALPDPENPSDHSRVTITIAAAATKVLIGKAGETIRGLEKKHGVVIRVGKMNESNQEDEESNSNATQNVH